MLIPRIQSIFKKNIFTLGLTVLWVGLSTVSPASAQTNDFRVVITAPYQDETFYAGLTSLVYTMNVTGQVITQLAEPSLLKVRLEIIQGNKITSSTTQRLNNDGSFSFAVTVNPDGSDGNFTPTQLAARCDDCHYMSETRLPPGPLVLRVTAIEPNGRQVQAERRIVVDHSSEAIVPVKVVSADNPIQTLANVPVAAVARFYLWRARHPTTITNNVGRAEMRVEALSEAETIYIFRVEPTVVNGILYESTESVTVTIPAKATSISPITLKVKGRAGKISGRIDGTLSLPITIRAILLPNGKAYSTTTSSTGAFVFSNLPIASYLVKPDDRALIAQGYSSTSQSVDLSLSPSASITMPGVSAQRGVSLHGTIRDTKGNPLPFAWVSIDQVGIAQSNPTDLGSYQLDNFPNQSLTAIVSAPGYYQLAQVVNASSAATDFVLMPRPETKQVAWGSGTVIVPPESSVSIETQHIKLEYGWLWGTVDNKLPLTLDVAGAEIVLSQGKFAIAYVSPDVPGWLYLFDGSATIRAPHNADAFDVHGGEMVALVNDAPWMAVPIDANVIVALLPVTPSPVEPIWEPTLDAQIRDRVAQMGISTAQVFTLTIYSLIVLMLVVAPVMIVGYRLRKRHLNL